MPLRIPFETPSSPLRSIRRSPGWQCPCNAQLQGLFLLKSARLARPAQSIRRHFPPHSASAIPAQAPPNRRNGPLARPDTLRIPFGRPADWLTGARPSPPNCPLSLGERVGVRGNGPYSNLTSQTLAGTVKLFESSGRAAGLPSELTHCPAANLLHRKASAAWEPAPPINTQLQPNPCSWSLCFHGQSRRCC